MSKVTKTEVNLPQLVKMDDDKCRARLIELRWPNGIECPRCHSYHITYASKQRHQFHCSDCHYQFSVTAGTSFQDSPIPLHTWFMIIYLNLESKDGITTAQTCRMFGVAYRTAWFMLMRIRNAMKPVCERKLTALLKWTIFLLAVRLTVWGDTIQVIKPMLSGLLNVVVKCGLRLYGTQIAILSRSSSRLT